jgi:hypothetical protein
VNPLIEAIVSESAEVRDRPFDALCRGLSAGELLRFCEELEDFRRATTSLYHGVRAALFLYSAHRFFLQESPEVAAAGSIPQEGYADLLAGRYESSIRLLRKSMASDGLHAGLMSALAEAYRHSAFQTLAAQVRRSVRSSRGNQWMFRVGHPTDHPVRFRGELLARGEGSLLYPILYETTPVRLDLSHSGWSDIFFLGMDYPEGARVINVSVDLGLYGRDDRTRPPINVFVRAIPEPLTSPAWMISSISATTISVCSKQASSPQASCRLHSKEPGMRWRAFWAR